MRNYLKNPVKKTFMISLSIALVIGILVTTIGYHILNSTFDKIIQNDVENYYNLLNEYVEANDRAVDDNEHKLNLQLKSLTLSIYQELKGKKLKDITQEDLIVLKEKYGLYDISLLKKTKDDITIAQSSDSQEIGLSTKDWGYWYTAFSQLFNLEKVTVEKGYYDGAHYYVGPYSRAEWNEKYFKYAYYYNSDIDFMINPYILADENTFLNANYDNFLKHFVAESNYLEEISVINADAYLHKKEIVLPRYDTPIIYGDNNLKDVKEKEVIKEVYKTKMTKSLTFTFNGKEYQKYYIPTDKDRVITLVFDNNKILKDKDFYFYLILTIVFLSIFITLAIFNTVSKKYWNTLIVDKDRLKVAEDFKRIVSILPNSIFILKKNDNNDVYIDFFEGDLTKKFKDKNIQYKLLKDVLRKEDFNFVNGYVTKALNGEEAFYNINLWGRLYQTIIKPIYKENSNEIIGVAGYSNDITEQQNAEEKIKKLAYFDSLTELHNREYCKKELDNFITEGSKNLSALFIDLDNFKTINETLGHNVGDEILKMVAVRLKSIIDCNHHIISRISGDEFIIVIRDEKDKDEIEQIVSDINQILNTPFMVNNQKITISASIGISLYPENAKTSEELIQKADIAMNCSKSDKKNSYLFYNDDMSTKVLKKLRIENALREAIDHKPFELYYQPQVDTINQKIIGVEALIRWIHPQLGFISPADFIPIAEETGLIEEIGEWTLYEACRQHKEWINQGLEPINISVNLSARQFKQKNLVDMIKNVISETKMDTKYLTLEITETTSMENIDFTIETLHELRKLGIKFAIDDFGTGYSSLNYLKQLPIETLKIDRSFINDMLSNHSGRTVVSSIINLAHSLNLKIVAEGVEELEQITLLEQLNSPFIQGYVFSPPIKAKYLYEKFDEVKNLKS